MDGFILGIEDVAPNPVRKGRKGKGRKKGRKTKASKPRKKNPRKRRISTAQRAKMKAGYRRWLKGGTKTRAKNPKKRRSGGRKKSSGYKKRGRGRGRRKNPSLAQFKGMLSGPLTLGDGLGALAAGIGIKALTAKYVKPASYGTLTSMAVSAGIGAGLAFLFGKMKYAKASKAFALATGAMLLCDGVSWLSSQGPVGQVVAMLPGTPFIGEGMYIPRADLPAGLQEAQYIPLAGSYGGDVPSHLQESMYMPLDGPYGSDLPSQLRG